MRPKQVFRLLKDTASSWSDDRAPSMGAAISYYSLFSMAPLLVILITVAGLFFGADQVQGAIFGQLSDLMGQDAARAVGEMLRHAQQPKTGGIAAAVSLAVLLMGASTVLAELQGALDVIWRAPDRKKENGLWQWLRQRLLTFSLVFAMAFLIVVSLALSAAVSALGKFWTPMIGGWEFVGHVLDLAISFGLLTVVFAAIYRFLPRATVQWHDVWIGAAVTSALFAIGKVLIGLYLGKSNVASGFGAFGSLALMMVWIYYSAQIFLFGAEFTWVYANEYGSRKDCKQDKPAAAPVAAPGMPEIHVHAALRNLEAANTPPAPHPSFVKRHLPEFAVSAAFLAGALLGKKAISRP
ncbi:MAG: YihY/virulence factor BrkB family protein [Clostridia bacterium]